MKLYTRVFSKFCKFSKFLYTTKICKIVREPWEISFKKMIKILEEVAISFSRGSFQPRNQTQVSCVADRFLASWVTREAHKKMIKV